MTRVAWTTVVRGTEPGEVHGALGFADLKTGAWLTSLLWDLPVSTSCRGGPRGLRGVLVHRDRLWVASADAILELDLDLGLRRIHRHHNLAHVHELAPWGDSILAVSTGFDCVLALDTKTGSWHWGLLVRGHTSTPSIRTFVPDTEELLAGDSVHLNQVHTEAGDLWISGSQLPYLIRMTNGEAIIDSPLPLGTHNAQPSPRGVLYCDTRADRVMWCRESPSFIASPRSSLETVTHLDAADGVMARIGFTRGLLRLDDSRVVFGTAPASLHLADFDPPSLIASVHLSADVRASIHGLCSWPHELPSAPLVRASQLSSV